MVSENETKKWEINILILYINTTVFVIKAIGKTTSVSTIVIVLFELCPQITVITTDAYQ